MTWAGLIAGPAAALEGDLAGGAVLVDREIDRLVYRELGDRFRGRRGGDGLSGLHRGRNGGPGRLDLGLRRARAPGSKERTEQECTTGGCRNQESHDYPFLPVNISDLRSRTIKTGGKQPAACVQNGDVLPFFGDNP